jgi:hypothetical protein
VTDGLQDKYKKKCAKVKELSLELKKTKDALKRSRSRYDCWTRWISEERDLLENLTGHIPKYFYKINYIYENKEYMEVNVLCFGERWFREALVIHLARFNSISTYTYDIEIVSAKRLY